MGSTTHKKLIEYRAWIKMFRVSNAPTIISNVMVALAIGFKIAQLSDFTLDMSYVIRALIFISIALLLVYFGGMVLNDASDAKRDKTLCPDRPIPMGIIKTKEAWLFGSIMLFIPLILVEMIHRGQFVFIALLDIVVLSYTFLHRWTFPCVVLMAACRGLVYFVALASFIHVTRMTWHIFLFMILIAIYTAILTHIGRSEHDKEPKQPWVFWMLVPAIVPTITFGVATPLAWVALVAFTTWLWLAWKEFAPKRNQKVAGMHKLLSGFCLLDCVFIASLGSVYLVLISACCFILTIAMQQKVRGT